MTDTEHPRGLHHRVLFCADTDHPPDRYEGAGFPDRRGSEGMHWLALDAAEIVLHPGGHVCGFTQALAP